jgi:hypothetical protein
VRWQWCDSEAGGCAKAAVIHDVMLQAMHDAGLLHISVLPAARGLLHNALQCSSVPRLYLSRASVMMLMADHLRADHLHDGSYITAWGGMREGVQAVACLCSAGLPRQRPR